MAGRLRKRLAILLNNEGITIKADDLQAAEGIHRQDDSGGTCRWGGYGLEGQHRVYLYSTYTMTDCVKYGIRFEPDSTQPNTTEVYPNWPVTEEDSDFNRGSSPILEK